MSISAVLNGRCMGVCELCNNLPAVTAYLVSPRTAEVSENQVALCKECLNNLDAKVSAQYWRCLEGSIWNPEPVVQALSYRILQLYKSEEWCAELLNSLELDENIIQWAMSVFEAVDIHKDCFGYALSNGDNVVLTQNLNVKGTNFSAPRGTIVKRIRLVAGNTDQIEGKINEQTIVLLTKYVKKG